jgi:hypothetical protein
MEDREKEKRKMGFKVLPVGIKRQAVSELESGMFSRADLAAKYGVSSRALGYWVQQIKGDHVPMESVEESTETMRLAANEVLCGICTVYEALGRHGLESEERLQYWIGRVRKENRAMRDAISGQSCDIAPMMKSKGKGDEVAQLRQELEAARMRVVALETLIEVAARDLGVNILKKPGTKQSRN